MNTPIARFLAVVLVAAPVLGAIRVSQIQLSIPRTSGCWAGWSSSTVAISSWPSLDIISNGQMLYANVSTGFPLTTDCVAGAGSNGVAVFTGGTSFYDRIIQFVDLQTGVAEPYNSTRRLPQRPQAAAGSSRYPRVVMIGLTAAMVINTATRTVDAQTLPFLSGGGRDSAVFVVTTAGGREWMIATGGDRGRGAETLPLDTAVMTNTSFVYTPAALARDRQQGVQCAANGNAPGTFVCASRGFDDHDYCTVADDGTVSCVAIPVLDDDAAKAILPAGPALLYSYPKAGEEVVDAVALPSLAAPAVQTRVWTYARMYLLWGPTYYMAMHAGNFAYIAGGTDSNRQAVSNVIVFEYASDATTGAPRTTTTTTTATNTLPTSTGSLARNVTLTMITVLGLILR